ncbi:efflux RND transporter periplasmic adaptor subunit [Paracidovorax avenae]|uniref:efflux RND transporter periplasmic adaptor subunit n=1 Tax=Paracidovorax avenae TaxID=80867 RepID=UPI000D20A96F|nr:efflux RND transporter periplasmic adaptor subunit [Paracidovorax avenae]AVT01650.1 efflux transporter periplasmic adaptor subunit [Paracidovorax avenae]
MKSTFPNLRKRLAWCGGAALLTAVAAAAVLVLLPSRESAAADAPAPSLPELSRAGKVADGVVRVSSSQAATLDLGPAERRAFEDVQQAIGNIDFNQDRTVPVSTAYAGRIARVLVQAGDTVRAGQTLYTVNVPDIAQAASALVSTAGTLRSATETLRRAQALVGDNSIAQKEYQQNLSDQQAADAAYRAARKTLQLFGLAEADIQRIERDHAIDVEMPVKSPIDGRVVARSAQPGLLTQPGASPAPVTVSDVRTLWMVASVPESDFSRYQVGQPVSVHVQAWPGRAFTGRIRYVGDTVDASTHRFVVRADVADPDRALRPQMLADFRITLAAPREAAAVPATAVVRETSGDNVVWVAQDAKDPLGVRLQRRAVIVGRSHGDQVQVTAGLQPGDRIARRNALLLSNLYDTGAAE